MMADHDFEEIWGPLAPHSDHTLNERIMYLDGETGAWCTGTILWVCAPGQVVAGGRHHPVRYIVLRDDREGFPDIVYPGEIIEG